MLEQISNIEYRNTVRTSYSKPVGNRGSALMGHKLLKRIDIDYLEEKKDCWKVVSNLINKSSRCEFNKIAKLEIS